MLWPPTRSGTVTFCQTVSQGSSVACWNTTPTSADGPSMRLSRQRECAGVGAVEAGEQAQQRALAAARRADQADELAVPHRHVEMVERQHRLAGHRRIDLHDAAWPRSAHRSAPVAPAVARRASTVVATFIGCGPEWPDASTRHFSPWRGRLLILSEGYSTRSAARSRYARIARTSKAATGRVKPFSSSSPTAASLGQRLHGRVDLAVDQDLAVSWPRRTGAPRD